MSRDKGWYDLPRHEYRIAKEYIRAYEAYLKAVEDYEDCSSGYDETTKKTTSYKTADDIADYSVNRQIVRVIRQSFEESVTAQYKKVVWDYATKRIKPETEFEQSACDRELKKWCFMFAKIFGIKTT